MDSKSRMQEEARQQLLKEQEFKRTSILLNDISTKNSQVPKKSSPLSSPSPPPVPSTPVPKLPNRINSLSTTNKSSSTTTTTTNQMNISNQRLLIARTEAPSKTPVVNPSSSKPLNNYTVQKTVVLSTSIQNNVSPSTNKQPIPSLSQLKTKETSTQKTSTLNSPSSSTKPFNTTSESKTSSTNLLLNSPSSTITSQQPKSPTPSSSPNFSRRSVVDKTSTSTSYSTSNPTTIKITSSSESLRPTSIIVNNEKSPSTDKRFPPPVQKSSTVTHKRISSIDSDVKPINKQKIQSPVSITRPDTLNIGQALGQGFPTLRKVSPPVEKNGMTLGKVIDTPTTASSVVPPAPPLPMTSGGVPPAPPPPPPNFAATPTKVHKPSTPKPSTSTPTAPPPPPPLVSQEQLSQQKLKLKAATPIQKPADTPLDMRDSLMAEIRRAGGAQGLRKVSSTQ